MAPLGSVSFLRQPVQGASQPSLISVANARRSQAATTLPVRPQDSTPLLLPTYRPGA